MRWEYFVKTVLLSELQKELTAFSKQGYDIFSLHYDDGEFHIVARKKESVMG